MYPGCPGRQLSSIPAPSKPQLGEETVFDLSEGCSVFFPFTLNFVGLSNDM